MVLEKLYIVTGANGHLGNTIVRMLSRNGEKIRGLILPSEDDNDSENVHYVKGDVRNPQSLEPLFEDTEGLEVVVIHTAGIVDISERLYQTMYDVNVNGTRNVVSLCMKHKVRRLVYVSSVHAIPENGSLHVLKEVERFSADQVVGDYAKTKAEASQIVLDATHNGLDAVVVHPSGILGPYDSSRNHLVQMVNDYIHGRLPACVVGGYDFVDVRDVAYGCLAAAERGKCGECYILSNRHYEVRDVLEMVRDVQGKRKLLPVLPMWMARAAVPIIDWIAKCRKKRPLYTRYSLYTLKSNDRFSHDKATCELNYRPRDLYQTIADTVAWIKTKSTSS